MDKEYYWKGTQTSQINLGALPYHLPLSYLAFLYLFEEKFSCSAMFSKKECANDRNLRFISRTNVMLSRVKHGQSFITSGPDIR